MNSKLIQFRKDLHQYPEVSGDEKKTAKRIKDELENCNADEIITELGGHGVLALFESTSTKPRKRLIFRAELDAIALQEETGVPYQSRFDHCMHGCGHDGHMTILIGLARELKKKRPDHTEVYLLFQPSEETGEGASRLLNETEFKYLKIDHGFALHNMPGFPTNEIIIKSGPFAAGSVGLDITIKGSNSHAAYPERGLNPSSTVAKLIQKIDRDMQVFRDQNETNKVVCTFINMGERSFGISPGKANVGLTIRSDSDETLDVGVKLIHEIIKESQQSFGGEITVNEVEPFRATVNSEAGTKIVKDVANEMGLSINVPNEPFPWSEDFGVFGKKFPITIFGLGAGEQSPPLHSEKFDFNDELIPTGVELFKRIVDYYESL